MGVKNRIGPPLSRSDSDTEGSTEADRAAIAIVNQKPIRPGRKIPGYGGGDVVVARGGDGQLPSRTFHIREPDAGVLPEVLAEDAELATGVGLASDAGHLPPELGAIRKLPLPHPVSIEQSHGEDAGFPRLGNQHLGAEVRGLENFQRLRLPGRVGGRLRR